MYGNLFIFGNYQAPLCLRIAECSLIDFFPELRSFFFLKVAFSLACDAGCCLWPVACGRFQWLLLARFCWLDRAAQRAVKVTTRVRSRSPAASGSAVVVSSYPTFGVSLAQFLDVGTANNVAGESAFGLGPRQLNHLFFLFLFMASCYVVSNYGWLEILTCPRVPPRKLTPFSMSGGARSQPFDLIDQEYA